MANIRITCPACNRVLEISDEFAGKEIECGECLQVFVAEKARGKKIPTAAPAKRAPSKRDDDDDDYEHDHRRDEYDDDYDDQPRRSRRGRGGRPPCSRLVYILLAIFLGGLGIHNFYAGRTGTGAAQLVITLVSVPLTFVCIGFVTLLLVYV